MLWKLGDYQVQRELARGGAGIVYLAHDPHLGRDVAVKVLQRAPHARAIQRFQTEARSLARLVHPHIVRVHAAGEHEGHPYFVMDYVLGASLQDRLRTGPLDPDGAAELVHKLARAVDYAHRQGVLHRDIKPANVIVDLEGEPRLADFGLAKAVDLSTATPLSVDGRTLGTLGFCSPEQATGQLPRIGPPTDVYGLGATLYAALTMRAPIEWASELEALTATCQREVQPPSVHSPAIPPELDAICLRSLAKAPSDRYASAAEFADALKAFLSRSPRVQGPNPARTNASLALAAMLVAALVLVAYRLGLDRAPQSSSPQSPAGASSPARASTPSPPAKSGLDTAQGSPTPRGESLAAEVERLLGRRDPTAAKAKVEAALAIDPQDFEALVAKTELLGYERRDAEVLELTRQLIRRDPSRTRLYFNRGYAFVELGRFQEGAAAYEVCVARNYRPKSSVFNRAVAYWKLDRYADALLDCDRCVKLGVNTPSLQRVRADCLRGVGRFREAGPLYAALVELEPKDAHSWFSLGLVRVNLDDLEGAIAAYTRALEAYPKHSYANYNRGMIYGNLGRVSEAIRDLELALALVPTRGERARIEQRIRDARAGRLGAAFGPK